jgi:hypothetical protein
MDEQVFTPAAGLHRGHRVRIAGKGLVKTAMQEGEAVTLRGRTALYCSCGDTWHLPDDTDFQAAIEVSL